MGRPRKDTPRSASDFVAYYRVSTVRQGESGLGLEAQRAAVARFLQNKGSIVAEYTEVESGKKNDRPQLAAALATSKRLNATLIIAKLDRLARNVAFIAKLMEDACDFVACDMPHANRLTLHIMAAMAEHEREMISARTSAGLSEVQRELKEKGFRVSKRSGRKFTKLGNPRWKESIAKATASRKSMHTPSRVSALIQSQRADGKSLPHIANTLNDLGIRTCTGARWYPSSVRAELLKTQPPALPKAA